MAQNLGQQMQQLYSQYGHLAGVAIECHQQLIALQIDNQQASATVFLQGAQLSHYNQKQQQKKGRQKNHSQIKAAQTDRDIIWCSPDCEYRSGQPLRGGIPICWPWFGQLDRNPPAVRQQIPNAGDQANIPAHGIVRDKVWQLSNIEILSKHETQLSLELAIDADQEPLWPYASLLCLTITIGRKLTLQLNITNRSDQTVNFCTALHSYFAIGDIDQLTITGLENLAFIDCVDNWSAQRQQGPVVIEGEVDRIYQGPTASIQLRDKSWQRSIELRASNSQSTVVWNPGPAKAKTLSQFPNLAYSDMVCIETCNADTDSVELAPGASHSLELIIQ